MSPCAAKMQTLNDGIGLGQPYVSPELRQGAEVVFQHDLISQKQRGNQIRSPGAHTQAYLK